MPALPQDPIFISYSRRDSEIMQKIVHYLRDQGFNVWVDNEKLIPGTPIWEEEIEKAISAASTVVVVMSPDSKNSEWVRREISLADQYRKHILPVLVNGDEDSSITLRLVTRQFIDLRKNETAGLASLQKALAEHLSKIHQPLEEKSASQIDQNTATTNTGNDISEAGKPLASPAVSQSLFWFILGWALVGFIAGYIYSTDIIGGDELISEYISGTIGNAIAGAIGGFMTAVAFENAQKNTFRTVLAWAMGAAIGWAIGRRLTGASGLGIGMALFPLIGLAGAQGKEYVLSNWKSTTVIVLAWAISSAIGWTISRTFLIDTQGVDKATSWAIGTAIAWGTGGFVTSWQILKTPK